jgi:hypothetical protein
MDWFLSKDFVQLSITAIPKSDETVRQSIVP